MISRLLRQGLWLLAAATLMWAQSKEPAGAEKFPEAEGRENVVFTCSACHTLVRVAANRRSAKSWTSTLRIHEGRGLHLEDDEIPPIVKYLSSYFGPMVNINTATAAQLGELPQVEDKLARAIVAYREKNGPFKKIEELTSVEGCDAGLFSKLKNRLETGGTGAAENPDAKAKQ